MGQSSSNSSNATLTEKEVNELVESTKYKGKEIREWYAKFTKNSSRGSMTREHFYDFYDQLFKTEDKSLVKKGLIFDLFDRNKDESVSFKEVMTALSILRRGPMSEKAEWLFDLYDINGNGEISNEEFVAIVDCLKEVGSLHFSLHKMSAVYQNLDTSKDGVVTKDEFLAGLKSYPELMNLFNCRQILPVL